MMVRRKKMELIQVTPTLIMMVFRMVKTISQMIQIKIKTPTVTESVMMKTQTMMVMESQTKKKMKMALIQRILTQTEMESMTVRRRRTELILITPIQMVTVLTMEMMISLKIQTRILTLMGMVREIILIPMTMGTVFQMNKKKKMVQIQPILTHMAMG